MLNNYCRLTVTKVPVDTKPFAGKAFGKSRGSLRVKTYFHPLTSLFVSLKKHPHSKGIFQKADKDWRVTQERSAGSRELTLPHIGCDFVNTRSWRKKLSNVLVLTPPWHFALKWTCSDSSNKSSGTTGQTTSAVPHPLLLSCQFNHCLKQLTRQIKSKQTNKNKASAYFLQSIQFQIPHVY